MGAETVGLLALIGGTAAGVTTSVRSAEAQRSAARQAKRANAAEMELVARRENEARLSRDRRAARLGNPPGTLFGSLLGAPTSKLGGGA